MPFLVYVFLKLVLVGVTHQLSTNHILLLTQPSQSRNSFFGFSNLFLPGSNGKAASIVVSAPRGSEDDGDTTEPGVIWKCSLGPISTSEKCQRIVFPVPKYLPGDPCFKKRCEWQDGGLLGMTLETNGNRGLLACAPKWQRTLRAGNPRLNGVCYFDGGVQGTKKRLTPLTHPAKQVVDRFPVHSWGQAGFSASLDGNDLLLGAPGVNAWNGTVIRYDSSSTGGKNFTIFDTTTLQLFYSIEYLGYAVTSGRYFAEGARYSVAGAPRGASLRGLVFVFQFVTCSEDPWFPEVVLEGDSFGTYFGSVLNSGDYNGDGLEELIVGAPFRSYEDPENVDLDINAAGDQGCIFVYTSKILLRSFGRPEVICGSNSPGARFGSSIALLGDINSDGFQDFAVGAPYEDDEGVVYIYHGKSTLGLTSSPSPFVQKIRPSTDFGFDLKGFGISIFGGVDLDKNGSPDIGIGAFRAETLAILRTRNVMSLENEIHLVVNGSLVEELEDDVDQFLLRTCTRFGKATINALDESFELVLDIELTLDPKARRFEIIDFEFTDMVSSPVITDGGTALSFSLRIHPRTPKCTEWRVERKPLVFSTGVEEIPEVEVHWKVTFTSQVSPLPGIRKYVLQDDKLHVSGESFDSFCALCPENGSATGTTTFPIVTEACEAASSCMPKFDMDISFFGKNTSHYSQTTWTLGSPLQLVVTIRNTGSNAGSPTLDLTWTPEFISFSNFEPFCTLEVGTAHFQCSVGTLEGYQSETLRITLDPFFAQNQATQLNISALLQPYRSNMEPNQNSKQRIRRKDAVISLVSEAKAAYFVGSSNTVRLNGNGSRIEFKQSFKMELSGESGVEASFHFWFPATFDDTPLISLYHTINGGCKIKKSGSVTNGHSSQLRLKNIDNDNLLTCTNPKVSCLHVSCPGRRIEAGRPEEFNFRFSLDVAKSRDLINQRLEASLLIQSTAEVSLFGSVVEEAFALTTIEDTLLSVHGSMGIASPKILASYVAGILGGVLGFTVLSICLLRCGFFQRNLKMQLLELQKQRQSQDWTYSPIYERSDLDDAKLGNADADDVKLEKPIPDDVKVEKTIPDDVKIEKEIHQDHALNQTTPHPQHTTIHRSTVTFTITEQ